MEKIYLNDKVVVSDPCYSIPSFGQKIVDNVLPGEYNVISEMTNTKNGFGTRNKNIIAVHSSYKINQKFKGSFNIVCVDSGQCGIFDFDSYRNDSISDIIENVIDFKIDKTESGDIWYENMCLLTLTTTDGWGVYKNGAVASSGYGDGLYELYLLTNKKNQVYGFKIRFI